MYVLKFLKLCMSSIHICTQFYYRSRNSFKRSCLLGHIMTIIGMNCKHALIKLKIKKKSFVVMKLPFPLLSLASVSYSSHRPFASSLRSLLSLLHRYLAAWTVFSRSFVQISNPMLTYLPSFLHQIVSSGN